MAFPKNFVWGAAAASYQIEGAACEDGKGDSVWDTFCRRKDAVWLGQSGEVACDHYHLWREDVALMKKMGLKAYRMSVSWPRVLPQGTGRVNAKGLEFYDQLVDGLLAAGVEPWITLFHWDYPQALFDRGGWLNRESADWFAEYTTVLVKKLSDRVTKWITLNEPQCFIDFGHRDGIHAPGLKLSRGEVLRACHHMLLAHGKSVQAIRAGSKKPTQVGWAAVARPKIPFTNSAADIEASRVGTFSISEQDITLAAGSTFSLNGAEALNNPWYMDPVYLGRYPEQGLKIYGADVPEIRAGDMETISQPLDFQGLNTYRGIFTRAGADGRPESVPYPVGFPLTHIYSPVTPTCLYWMAKFAYERYKLPIIVTESGMANTDWVSLDGKVHDPQRIDYVRRHLLELERAGDEGVALGGYFLWSLMDNFEWAFGYKERFGLVYVDYETQKRTMKDSALWYAKVMATKGEHLRQEP
jgi:beta-glucosidase